MGDRAEGESLGAVFTCADGGAHLVTATTGSEPAGGPPPAP
ncbi:MAG: hypothetical protein V4709_10360 [Pseudomonadota bacterium]